jgi:DNA-binding response OmpR family regulator
MAIAIVEDEQKLARSLKEGLVWEGYETDTYPDGESLQKYMEHDAASYELLILDLGLPGKSGFDVCQDLRARGSVMPILILTAKDTTEDKVRALDSGADDFMSKPFSYEELLARVRALLRRSRSGNSRQVHMGEVTIDLDAYTVTRAGKPVSVTLKDFELLAYLAEHRGQAKSRDEIFSHLWEHSDSALSNVVDVHVRNIRHKLDDDHEHKIIRTVRGVGYAVQG